MQAFRTDCLREIPAIAPLNQGQLDLLPNVTWREGGPMTLTEKTIECAHVVCARGQNTKKMALEMWCNAFHDLQLVSV